MARVSIDTRDYRNFYRAMSKVSRETGRELRRAERAGAAVIAADARDRAAEHSKTIPDTIKPFTYGAATGVQAGNASVAIAVLFEEGNAGGSERDLLRSQHEEKFGHWTFGHDPWVKQDMHPYLGPAAIAKQQEAVDLMLEHVNHAFESQRLELT